MQMCLYENFFFFFFLNSAYAFIIKVKGKMNIKHVQVTQKSEEKIIHTFLDK